MSEDADTIAAREADLARFRKSVRSMDSRAGAILAYHATLETELLRLISVILPRGRFLNKMGFANAVRVFQASYWAEPAKTDSLVDFLRIFGELRNSIAHGDTRAIVDSWVNKLRAHYEVMPGSNAQDANATLEDMASDIAGTLAGLTYKLQQQRPSFP